VFRELNVFDEARCLHQSIHAWQETPNQKDVTKQSGIQSNWRWSRHLPVNY